MQILQQLQILQQQYGVRAAKVVKVHMKVQNVNKYCRAVITGYNCLVVWWSVLGRNMHSEF